MGVGSHNNRVSVINFGLAMKYRDVKTHCHILYSEHHHLVGTAAFASLNNHEGVQQSRRDDLESLGYVLIYFLRGSMPWHNAQTNKRRRGRAIMQKKVSK